MGGTAVERRRVLRHPRRRQLHDLIRAKPGIHLRALSRELGIGLGVLRMHLRVLRRDGLVTSRRTGRRRVYSVPAYIGSAGLSRRESLFAEILGNEGLSVSELAARVGVSRMLAHYHVENLRRTGKVSARRDGRSLRLFARPSPQEYAIGWNDPPGGHDRLHHPPGHGGQGRPGRLGFRPL